MYSSSVLQPNPDSCQVPEPGGEAGDILPAGALAGRHHQAAAGGDGRGGGQGGPPAHSQVYVHCTIYTLIHDALMQVHHPAVCDLRVPVRSAVEHV